MKFYLGSLRWDLSADNLSVFVRALTLDRTKRSFISRYYGGWVAPLGVYWVLCLNPILCEN